MKYAFLVAWREYAESVKAKGFWIGILIMPIVLFLSIQAPMFLEKKATPTRYYVLLDQSANLASVVESRLENAHQQKVLDALIDYARKYTVPAAEAAAAPAASIWADVSPAAVEAFIQKGGKNSFLAQIKPRLKPDAPPFSEPRRLFQRVELPASINADADLGVIAEALKPYLRGEKPIEVYGRPGALNAAILIPRDIESQVVRPGRPRPAAGATAAAAPGTAHPPANADAASPAADHQIQYWSVNASDPRLRDEVERAINTEVRRREYLSRGLDLAAVRQVEQTYAPLTSLNPKKEKGKEAVSTSDTIRQWAPSGFVYLLWLAIFVIIQMLLNNTIEEKSNRIIEVLLSSVTPGELMMGKLFGIAAIGLTMVGAWMLFLFGILSWQAGGASQLAGQILVVLKGSNLVPLFSVYFLLGYLMYAAFILSIGSVCNTLKEAQNYMSAMTLLMMVPLLTMTFIPKDPNGTLARVLSWIPFYTPFTMMNRAAADPPLVDLIGTLLLLVASAAAAIWMAGKIFRIGILRTGQPPKIVELLRWAMGRRG